MDDHRAGKLVVSLNGRRVEGRRSLQAPGRRAVAEHSLVCRINKCGVISPRYNIKHNEIEAWVGRLMPSRLVRAC